MIDKTDSKEREALVAYLQDCDEKAIVPDVAGAWHAAFQAGRASLAANAGSEPVAQPTEDVQKKIQSNTWDHFGAILPTLKAISRGDWYWGANSRCKYIEIRLDTRDGGCLLFDRERVRISPEQFAHQSYGGFKMEPWPAYSGFTHPSPPEGMVMVPIVPTKAMLLAGSADLRLGDCIGTLTRAAECYRAMLEAAPPTTSAGSGKGE